MVVHLEKRDEMSAPWGDSPTVVMFVWQRMGGFPTAYCILLEILRGPFSCESGFFCPVNIFLEGSIREFS